MRWILTLLLLVLLSGCSLIENLPKPGGDPGENIVPGEVVTVLAPPPGLDAIDVDELESFLNQIGFNLEAFTGLAGNAGPCSGTLAVININDVPLGVALTLLEGLEAAGIATPLGTDPKGSYSSRQVDYLSAINANAAFESDYGGEGTTIAVFDSGVSENDELGARLLEGYNAIDEDANTQDNDLHGTPVAVLAAGSTLGVAREASVLPIKVCEGEECFSSDVIKGMCWAIDNAPDGPDALVMNLSLGGDTPSEIIAEILDVAIERGVVVAAAGGNDEERDPVPHYPAANDLSGLMAVASVEEDEAGEWVPTDFSTRGDYIDIAAPGVGFDLPGIAENIAGTSYSTPLVSGTMAVLRGANPDLSPARIQGCIEAGAKALSDASDAVGEGLLNVAGALEACGL